MRLEIVAGDLAVCRLGPGEPLPGWADPDGTIRAVVRTAEELSIVCDADQVPDGVESTGPWRALRVAGTLDHGLTGILAALATPLADGGVPIFAISTFDTDYLLVPTDRVADARTALEAAGHLFVTG